MIEFTPRERNLFAVFVLAIIALAVILAALVLLPKIDQPYIELYFDGAQSKTAVVGKELELAFIVENKGLSETQFSYSVLATGKTIAENEFLMGAEGKKSFSEILIFEQSGLQKVEVRLKSPSGEEFIIFTWIEVE